MIIVFDTNIWLQNLYLQAPAGAAARFFILKNNAQVALPEVIRLEVEHHLRNDMRSFSDRIKDNHKRLLALFGKLKELVLPTDSEINEKVSQAFTVLGLKFIEVPFSFESARDSFLRTIRKLPPSEKSQQFKDGVLWADCLSLLQRGDVVLVTEDKAFYEGNEHSNGISRILENECKAFSHRLTLLPRLIDLLEEIRTDVALDHDALTSAFFTKVGPDIEGLLQRLGFQLGKRLRLSSELFVTEKPQRLFLEFSIEFQVIDVSGEGRGDGLLKTRGDGLYNAAEGKFINLDELGTELHFQDRDGVSQRRANVIMRVQGITIGHADVAHSIRHKLE